MKDSDKPKLIVAVLLLVVAVGVFAWYMGLFGGSTPPPVVNSGEAPKASGGPHSLPGTK